MECSQPKELTMWGGRASKCVGICLVVQLWVQTSNSCEKLFGEPKCLGKLRLECGGVVGMPFPLGWFWWSVRSWWTWHVRFVIEIRKWLSMLCFPVRIWAQFGYWVYLGCVLAGKYGRGGANWLARQYGIFSVEGKLWAAAIYVVEHMD